MENVHELLVKRRSIRKYTQDEVSAEDVKLILEAALMSPTSKNCHSWQFVVVEDRKKLEALSQCKPQYATFVARSSFAIVVTADPTKSGAWIEDASIAAAFIQLQAEDLGIGSCWVQVRGHMHDDDYTADEYIKAQLNIPGEMQVLCIISLGHKDEERKPFNPEKMLWEHVHIGEWRSQE